MPNLPIVLINCASCSVGGGIQVAVGLVGHLAKSSQLPFKPVFALSPQVAKECGAVLDDRFNSKVFPGRPGALLSGWRTRRDLPRFADAQGARVIFTVMGPSYARFRQPELSGFADGFAFAKGGECYLHHPWPARLKARLLKPLKLWFLRGSSAFWVEAKSAQEGLASSLSISRDRITIIPNAMNVAIRDSATGSAPVKPPMFLLLAAGYWHKNFAIIAPMAKALTEMMPDSPFSICVTLPNGAIWDSVQSAAKSLGVADKVRNLGPLSLRESAQAIEDSTAVLHPSLLETFSATYLEAMGLRRPILASDRPFAREICGDAALYFDPHNPTEAARQAFRLLQDSQLQEKLLVSAATRLAQFPTPEQKNEQLVKLISDFANQYE